MRVEGVSYKWGIRKWTDIKLNGYTVKMDCDWLFIQ